MPTTSFDKDSIKASIIGKLQRYNGRTIEEASNGQIYRALASTVRDQIMQKWMISREERKTNNNKRLFYLSVEFLMGRSLYTNILNLVSLDAYKQALDELHIKMNVREVRLSAGAGFVVVICGSIMTMPGLPKHPAAMDIDVDAEGRITGLF